jgi:hypothetical protein
MKLPTTIVTRSLNAIPPQMLKPVTGRDTRED